MSGRRVVMGVLAAACVSVALLPSGASAGLRDRSCGWIFEPTYDRENVLFPEQTTRYLGAIAPVPPGGYVEIRGQFPRGRYMSLQTYTTTLQSISVIRDEQIVPAHGSTNPFLPGADRTTHRRNYVVKLIHGTAPPGGGTANTLYDTGGDGKSGRALVYRLYLPDRRARPFGGVPAPSLTFVLANGIRIPVPTCPDLFPDTTPVTELLAGAGFPLPLPRLGLLGIEKPTWHRYVNAPSSVAGEVTENEFTDRNLGPLLNAITTQLPSGFGENADNKYIYTYLSQEFGRVAAFRAKLPTMPETFDGEATMGTGQLRFWSMCSGNPLTMAYGCLVDEQVPVDADGYYTLAFSTAADRPTTARPECGISWLPWGPVPKGILIMRNMLPAPDFANAIQKAKPGNEKRVLGPYYPRGRYFPMPAAFDSHFGC